MSNDSQLPEKSPTGNQKDLSTGFIGFGESDLWELDDQPASPQSLPSAADKSYGMMEKSEFSEDSENLPTYSKSTEDSTSLTTSLTKLEKISLLAITATLIICSVLAIIHFSKEIPVDSEISKKVSLPVEGKILNVTLVETYWRTPITQGDNPDTAQRGVILIPVIKIQVSGTNGALRIFFRDSDGILVGDSTTVPISGKETLTISATGGFTDMGMHASYRTGENPPWMIQALEGPSVDAPIGKFKNLFKTEISTDIR